MLPINPLLNATAPAGPHLPTATLRQYAAGTLAPAAQHRVEAHTLACPRCADILEGLLQTTPATTDQALAQLQQRLRRRVQQPAPAALPATRTRHRHRWLALQLAATAALLFGLVAGGWWTWQQRHAAPATATRPAASGTSAPAAKAPAVAELPASLATPVAKPAVSAAEVTRPAAPRLVARRQAAHYQARAAKQRSGGEKVDAASATSPALAATNGAVSEGIVASVPAAPGAPAPAGSTEATYDSSGASGASGLLGRAAGVAVRARAALPAAAPPATNVRRDAMPAAPNVPPTPVGGYSAWRESLRREAAEFQPDAPDAPLSGSVQLRITVGADGKVQEIRVLHGLRADYDAEAQRLVCAGPGWVPGVGGGKRAAQSVDIAVPF